MGVTLHHQMSWNTHIHQAATRANNTQALIRRNLRTCPKSTKEQCYKTLVRPILEYAAIIWDPHTQSNIQILERVQRRAARYVMNDYDRGSSVSTMISQLGWSSLQQRRSHTKIIMLYRIVHHLVAIPPEIYLQPTQSASRTHHHQYLVPYARTQTYQYSFFPSTIRLWNHLPEEVIAAPTLDTFRAQLAASAQ